MSRFNKIFRVIFIALLAFSALVLLTSTIISLFYEKAAIRFLKSYLDDHLRTQITVEDIRFRLLKGFPNATFELKNIAILSGENFSASGFSFIHADTLLEARRVTFQFDLFKLMNRRYELKQIDISNGTINILIDRENRNNLSIWDGQENTETQDQTIDLNSIRLNAMHMNLISLPAKLYFLTSTDKMVVKGSITHDVIFTDVRGDLMILDLTVNNKSQLQETGLQFQLSAVAGEGETVFNEGEIIYDKTSCLFSANMMTGQSGTSFHIDLEVPDFRLEDMMSLVHSARKMGSIPLDLEGKGMISASLDGILGTESTSCTFRSKFEMNKANATFRNSGKSIENINGSGSASGTLPGSVSFQISPYSSSISEGQINGELLLNREQENDIILHNKSIINLGELYDLIDADSIKNMKGLVSSDFTAVWSLSQGTSISFEDFLDNMDQGEFLARDINVETSKGRSLQNITGRFAWKDSLTLDSVSFTLDQNRYLLNGTITDLAAFVTHHGNLSASLSIASDKLDLSSYLPAGADLRDNRPVRRLNLPSRLDLNASILAKEFVINQFHASGLHVDLLLKEDTSYFNSFNFNFLDGSISGNALIIENPSDGFSITCNATTRLIDIHELFGAFNNFTQHFIVGENVRGRLEGSVRFTADWDLSFRLMPATIKALADIEIDDGELVQFEPMMKLSRYFDAEELMRVKFSTLKNQILISDRMVTIPEMEIHSSAFNITASGKHSFDNAFDYRLRVLLSEVLFNRAKSTRSEINEFYVDEDVSDQRGIPLIIAGTPENYDVQFDRKAAFDLSGQNGRNNENNLQNNPDPPEFIIEWGGIDDARNAEEKPDSEPSGEEFIFQWDEEEETGR